MTDPDAITAELMRKIEITHALAVQAASQINTHEQVCAERYNSLHKELASITDNVKDLNKALPIIQRTISMAVGGGIMAVGLFQIALKVFL